MKSGVHGRRLKYRFNTVGIIRQFQGLITLRMFKCLPKYQATLCKLLGHANDPSSGALLHWNCHLGTISGSTFKQSHIELSNQCSDTIQTSVTLFCRPVGQLCGLQLVCGSRWRFVGLSGPSAVVRDPVTSCQAHSASSGSSTPARVPLPSGPPRVWPARLVPVATELRLFSVYRPPLRICHPSFAALRSSLSVRPVRPAQPGAISGFSPCTMPQGPAPCRQT